MYFRCHRLLSSLCNRSTRFIGTDEIKIKNDAKKQLRLAFLSQILSRLCIQGLRRQVLYTTLCLKIAFERSYL